MHRRPEFGFTGVDRLHGLTGKTGRIVEKCMRQLERLNGPKEIMQLCLETGAATFAGTIDYKSGYRPEVGTLKMRMGATHFLMKRLPKVATEMALHVLAYNLTRVMNIMGIQPLMAAIPA